MLIPSPEDFLTRYPEFVDADPERIRYVVEEAALYTDSQRWIEKYRIPATLALAAHLLYAETEIATAAEKAVSGEIETAGPITKKTVGPLSISYGNQSASGQTQTAASSKPGTGLAENIYGQRFLDFVLRSFGPAVLVV